MAPPPPLKRLSSTSSHHAPQPPRLSLSITNPNVFSDDNALDSITPTPDSTSSPSEDSRALPISSNSSEAPAVDVHRRSSRIEDHNQNHKRRSLGDNEPSNGIRREGSSAQNPHHHHHHHHHHPMYAGSLSEMPKGSTSSASAFAMPRTQSPYQGATGPSHPYGMYPQDIGISRTPSAATIPTARAPERAHPAVGGPTQPYGMYPQNTVPEDDDIMEAEVIQPMPGFPGRQRNYQRRFGPDSDEAADIVGPDGYTEQLPAYTRYANDIPPKSSASPAPGTRREEPQNQPGQSRDTLNTIISEDSDPRSPAVGDSSTRLRAPLAGGTTALRSEITALPAEATPFNSTGVGTSSDGGHFKELVKERGKRRVCWGKLPMWLCMLFLVVGACVVGGLIGGILGRAKGSSEGVGSRLASATFSLPTVTVTATSLVDAEPISSPPAGLPTPIPGTYTIPLQNATYMSDECVQDPQEAPTWDCTGGALMELSITIVDSDPVVLFNYSDSDGPLDITLSMVRYGAQPPILDGYTTMSLMNAKDHMEKGPAYVFHKQFDKLVVLPEEAFDETMSWRQRRDTVYSPKYNFSQAVYARAGQKPWFCYWNGTLLEGFIFVTQVIESHNTVIERAERDNDAYGSGDFSWDTSSQTVSTFHTPPGSPTTPFSLLDSVSSSSVSSSSASSPSASSPSVSGPSSLTDASVMVASVTVIPAPPDISVLYPFWTQESVSAASAASASAASATSTMSAFDAAATVAPVSDENGLDLDSYDRYPTVIKIEERRDLENQVGPYCQQMLIMEDKSVQSIDQRRFDVSVAQFGELQSRRSKKRSSGHQTAHIDV